MEEQEDLFHQYSGEEVIDWWEREPFEQEVEAETLTGHLESSVDHWANIQPD